MPTIRVKRITILISAVLLGLVGVCFLAWWLWFNVFYYQDFNALKRELESIPKLKIVDEWRHEDITLEDCGFVVIVDDSEPIGIDFYDVSSWKSSFKPLDGIVVSLSYDRSTDGYARTAISVSDLRSAGVDAEFLEEALQSTDIILDLARSRPATTGPLGIRGKWVTIYRYLDRNKGEQDVGKRTDTALKVLDDIFASM